MTLEKAIEFGKIFLKSIENEKGSATYEFVETAVKMMEQEPCEDCISRQKLKEQMIKYGFHAPDMTVTEFVEDLSSVTSQPKTGHWEWLTEDKYRCSNCNHETRVDECMNEPMYDFCPFCGVRTEGRE